MEIVYLPPRQLRIDSKFADLLPPLSSESYSTLRRDIEKRGIQRPLDIRRKDFIVLDGKHRRKIAIELDIAKVPCYLRDFPDDAETLEFAIVINLARRQLTTEQKYILYAKLSTLYQSAAPQRGKKGRFIKSVNDTVSSADVLEKTAELVGENPRTIARARAYMRAITEMPSLKGLGTVIGILNEYDRKRKIKNRKRMLDGKPELKNLILGDAAQCINEIADNSVDMLLTDPPYGMANIAGRRQTYRIRGKEWLMEKDDESIFTLLDNVFSKVQGKLKDNAHIYVFTSWQKWHRLYSIMKRHFRVLNCLIWKKNYPSLGELQGYNYRYTYDMIIFASAGKNRLLNWKNELKPLNIIEIDGSRGFAHKKMHPAEKPINLLKTLISYSTVENETVLDCFAGSGSTLVAAEELHRNWIGIEIDPNWYNVAKERIFKLRNI